MAAMVSRRILKMRVSSLLLLALPCSAINMLAPLDLFPKFLSRISLEDVDPLAVCTDGTPAGYYYSASETESTDWIIHLQGGGWCFDEQGCNHRCPAGSTSSQCSSKLWEDHLPVLGLMKPGRAFENANLVVVRYCTSDAHMGDSEAFGMQFRGHRVLQATLDDLVARQGLGAERGHRIVISGNSAGARGAMIHLGYIKKMVGGEVSKRVSVLGILDSPLWLDEAVLNPNVFSWRAQSQLFVENMKPKHFGGDCLRDNPDESWKCILAEYRLPYVRVPYIVIAAQYDSFQLDMSQIYPSTMDPIKIQFASYFAHRTVDLLKSLRENWPEQETVQNAVLSWACYDHGIMTSSKRIDTMFCTDEHVMYDDAVRQFINQKGGEEATSSDFAWIDSCDGFACGPGCAGDQNLARIRASADLDEGELDHAVAARAGLLEG
eukprot:TRINITY_DN32309_c0_g1_i1.p1 TRINITY_DN32309_c0_g1~~TRINITY_DN32309_c0_g1_i1.p1  ORF type:complete len:446 (+),score=72.95 TRINITY_DN32309_c0_g1_i1:36-1340(+)